MFIGNGEKLFFVGEKEMYAVFDGNGKDMTGFVFTELVMNGDNTITGRKTDGEYSISPKGEVTLLKKN